MSAGRLRVQGGFTFFEVVIAGTLLLAAVSVFATVMGSTDRLTRESHVHTRVTTEHRRNLHNIANHLNTAWIESLDGFDEKGEATLLRFQRAVSQNDDGAVYGPEEAITWAPVPGIPNVAGRVAGRVVLVRPGQPPVLMADRVPQGTFLIRQEGRNLIVRLGTYYRTTNEQLVQVTSETSVMLRN